MTDPTLTLDGFDYPSELSLHRSLWVRHDTPEMFDLAYAIEGGGLSLIDEIERRCQRV